MPGNNGDDVKMHTGLDDRTRVQITLVLRIKEDGMRKFEQCMIILIAAGSFSLSAWYTFTPIMRYVTSFSPWIVLIAALPIGFAAAGCGFFVLEHLVILAEDTGNGWREGLFAVPKAVLYGIAAYECFVGAAILDALEQSNLIFHIFIIMLAEVALIGLLIVCAIYCMRWMKKKSRRGPDIVNLA